MPATEPLPEVTDEHRRQAFALHAPKWPGVTFEQAMQVDIRRKLIEVCAHALRKDQARADRHPQPYRTTRPSADIPRAPPALPAHQHPARRGGGPQACRCRRL